MTLKTTIAAALLLAGAFAFPAAAKVTCKVSKMDDTARCRTDSDAVKGGGLFAPSYHVATAGSMVMLTLAAISSGDPVRSDTLYIRIDGGPVEQYSAHYSNDVSCGYNVGCTWTNTYTAVIPADLMHRIAAAQEARISVRSIGDGALLKPASFARWIGELQAKGVTLAANEGE